MKKGYEYRLVSQLDVDNHFTNLIVINKEIDFRMYNISLYCNSIRTIIRI